MRWGLVPFWAWDERDGAKRINARSETFGASACTTSLIVRKIMHRTIVAPVPICKKDWELIGNPLPSIAPWS